MLELHVKDFSFQIKEQEFMDLFRNRYPSCFYARLMTDRETGKSKGYGFARFSSADEMQKALKEMNGYAIHGKTLLVTESQQTSSLQNMTDDGCVVCIHGIPEDMSQQDVQEYFQSVGSIKRIVSMEDGVYYLQYATKISAEKACQEFDQTKLKDIHTIRIFSSSFQDAMERKKREKGWKDYFVSYHRYNLGWENYFQIQDPKNFRDEVDKPFDVERHNQWYAAQNHNWVQQELESYR